MPQFCGNQMVYRKFRKMNHDSVNSIISINSEGDYDDLQKGELNNINI
jgi:hypothetical protein